MRLSLLSFFTLLSTLPAIAQQVAEPVARERATEFLQMGRSAPSPQRGAASVVSGPTLELAYTSSSAGDTHYYIYNDATSGGFVIVSGDERALPVLGYCDHGSFDYVTAPDNLKCWLAQYDTQIAAIMTEGVAEDVSRSRMSGGRGLEPRHEDIPDLIEVPWSQESPNNLLCPVDSASGKHCVVGCVATATTILMRYYQWPSMAMGHNYDWENMLLDYRNVDYTEAQGMAVAQLSVDCAESLKMNFGVNASDASSSNVPGVLTSFFGFDRRMTFEERYYYTDEEWEELVYRELAAGRPLYYRAKDEISLSGHAFNCVGYSSYLDMYSINWGWGGYYNGYYALTAAPGFQVASFDFSLNHTIIADCKPDYSGDSQTAVVIRKRPNSNYTVTQKENQITLKVSLRNISTGEATVTMGLKATYELTGESFIVTGNEENLSTSYKTLTLKLPLDNLPYNGTYALSPIYRATNEEGDGEWQDVGLPVSDQLPTISVTGKETHAPIEVSFSLSDSVLALNQVMQIVHATAYDGEITYQVNDEAIATVSADGVIIPRATGSLSIEVHASAVEGFLETLTTLKLEIVPVTHLTEVSLADNALYVGETGQISVANKNYLGTICYTSNDPTIAQVDEKGVVTANRPGQTSILVEISSADPLSYELTCIDVTVLTANPVIEEGSFGFAQWPTLPNDNHPSSESLDMGYTLRNMSNDTVTQAYIRYEVLHGEESLKRGFFGFNNLPPHSTAQSLSGWGPVKSIVNKMVVGETYELRFYTDADYSVAANVPSLTFVWCETRAHELLIPAYGWTTVCLPFGTTLPEGVQSYACTACGAGIAKLVPSVGLEQWVPYIVCGEPGSYKLTGSSLAEVQCRQLGLLAGYVGGTAAPGTHDYRLMKREGVVAFYALSADQDLINEGEAVLRLPDGWTDYPEQILIEDIVQGRMPGDVDGNGAIEETDLQLLLNQLLERPQSMDVHFFPSEADYDANGAMTLSDLTSIIEKLKK